MNKWIYIIIGILVFLGGGFFVLNNYIYNQKQDPMQNSLTPSANPTADSAADSTVPSLVTPISHASMILHFGEQVIYNDPVGVEAFADQPAPNIILVSDIHGDHLNAETLAAVSKEETIIIVPQAVANMLSDDLPGTVEVMQNGGKQTIKGIEIEAVPMYNFPESADARHTKGRGNGYVLSAVGQRIYIAGDTGPTPEMKALQNIDVAFVPMNPPFTMTVEEAAEAVIAFKPKQVYPYHYRGQAGLSDTNKFKQLVEAGDPNIQVQLLNFYP